MHDPAEMRDETPIDPDRPVIDPHHHLWEILAGSHGMQEPNRVLFHETIATIAASGHNIVQTVCVESGQMYRAEGPAAMKPVGETEFLTGAAAMSASGLYGPVKLGAGIVGSAQLSLGAAIEPVLAAHVAAAGGRFRGIRQPLAYSEAGMFGFPCPSEGRTMLVDPLFREGVRVLAAMGLSLDVWCFHTQLGQLAELADAVPEATIILDHVGTPETLGRYAGRREETRAEWLALIGALAERPNVCVKLGGLGMDPGAAIGSHTETAPSEVLAARWRPYIEPCIEAFGPQRAMFESNFPPDEAAGSYGAIWNAFKRIAADCTDDVKTALFHDTAARVYRLG